MKQQQKTKLVDLYKQAKQILNQSSLLLIPSLFLMSCNDHSKTNSDSGTQKPDEKTAATCFYEPAISTLSGTIKKEIFWGAPNYGEDTATDEKEVCLVLYLQSPINTVADSADDFNEQKSNITKIQLVTNISPDKLVNKTVTVKGQLFGAQTGHHHTEVLLNLKEIQQQE